MDNKPTYKKPVVKKAEPKEVKVSKYEALKCLEDAECALEPFGHSSFSSGCSEVDKDAASMLKECAMLRVQLSR